MASLTKLESKLAEVLGLAMAAQDALRDVRGMLSPEHEALAKKLAQSRDEARETQRRCTALASTFKGKKTAIQAQAREVKQEAAEMRDAYLGGEEDPLDGFEFLTMAEAGDVGHWSIVSRTSSTACPSWRPPRTPTRRPNLTVVVGVPMSVSSCWVWKATRRLHRILFEGGAARPKLDVVAHPRPT